MELSSTAHGVYNLGFLGISRSEEGHKCVDWWAERLFLFCYDDIQRGIFTDQKWFDLAPCFFNVKIFKHHGYDFAPWSLMNCNITQNNAEEYFIEGDHLRFIHFSGYGYSAQKCMDDWLPEEGVLFRRLYAEYSAVHDANDSDNISKTPWSYANYTSGERVKDSVRRAYRSNWDAMFAFENPFEHSNAKFCRVLGKYSKWVIRFDKAKKMLKKDGLSALVRFCVKWVKEHR